MVVKVAYRERDIDIAGFTDGFPVVEDFHDRQKTCVFLHQAGNGIQNAGALVAVFGPCLLGFTGCFDSHIDFVGRALGDACKTLASRWVIGREIIA